MDKESFRRHGHEFIDWLADYLENTGSYPVTPETRPGDIMSRIPSAPPLKGEGMDKIFMDFRNIIMPGITHWQHPGWFAYFPANNSPASILAELLTAGLGVQCMSWQTSPSATELEQRVMEWLRQMTGLPDSFTGVIQDTASTASLCALLSARESATGFLSNREGVREPLVVYASTETHSSIEKDVKIAGYGSDNLRRVDTRGDFSMCPDSLEQAIKNDIASGLKPACVVATLGTTSSMAMDPVDEIADICSRYGIWLHVDAAFAGTAAVDQDNRGFMKGTEKCDSFVFNPHKWMLTNFDCSAYFVRDPDILVKTLGIQPEYLKTAADDAVKNYRDWGIQLGRRFRALKLWFVLRSYGVEGIREMVRRHIDLAAEFGRWIGKENNFELLAPVRLSLVCFRYIPDGTYTEKELSSINRKILERVNSSGRVFMTHTVLGGKYCIRMSVGQRATSKMHVELAWRLLKEAAHSIEDNA